MGKSPNSRTFADFPSPPKAADGCIASFEESLKLKNATKSQISYAASDLHAWLDSLPQAGALVFDAKLQAYVPFDKAWLKQQVLLRLQEHVLLRKLQQQKKQQQTELRLLLQRQKLQNVHKSMQRELQQKRRRKNYWMSRQRL